MVNDMKVGIPLVLDKLYLAGFITLQMLNHHNHNHFTCDCYFLAPGPIQVLKWSQLLGRAFSRMQQPVIYCQLLLSKLPSLL